MKLQQLRYIVEIQRQGLNVSEAAESLFTSQPGISKQVKLLEEELGIAIFERSGKRFTAVTEPGRVVLAIAEKILREAENLKRASAEFATGDSGRLVLAATAGAINVRLGGEALKARSEPTAVQHGLEMDAELGDSDSTPGVAPEVGHLRSVVGLVWRSVVVWMLLLALLTLARLLG